MDLKGISRQIVEEAPYGVYVWQMPDGRWVGDEDGNFLNVAAMKGDFKKVQTLTDAVKAYGIEEGAPYFLSGHRRVTDEEFEEQRMRLELGLTPDPYDIPALTEELKYKKHYE